MATTTLTLTAGFYATDAGVFYLTPAGRLWIVSSPDFDGIREVGPADLPADATPADDLLTPDECIGYCLSVEAESGETLTETA
jgi:hypothetical protein